MGPRLALAAIAWLGLWAPVGCSESAERTAGTIDDAPSIYGVQLHVHGSTSEGRASMRGQNAAARALGGAVDVIWWSDHDWRIANHTYVTDFGFEQGMSEIELVPAPLRAAQWDETA